MKLSQKAKERLKTLSTKHPWALVDTTTMQVVDFFNYEAEANQAKKKGGKTLAVFYANSIVFTE